MKKSKQCHSILMAASLFLASGCVSYEEVKRQADAGDPAKQYQAAQMLLEGDGVPRNEAEAEKYLLQAMKADNLSAACCVAKRILRRKKGDESELLMKAYDLVFSREPRGGYAEFSAVFDCRRHYPEDVLSYVRYLNQAGFWKSSMKFRKFAVQYLDRDKCKVPGRTIAYCKKKLADMKSPQEIAEEKRLAEEKRKAEEAKWNNPEFKFPMRKISDRRVPLSNELVSGVSWAWFKRIAANELKKEWQTKNAASQKNTEADVQNGRRARSMYPTHRSKNPKMPSEEDFFKKLSQGRSEYSTDFDGFYLRHHGECLVFAMEKPLPTGNQDQAVLVRREFQLNENVTPDAAIRKILQDNPGAKHERKTKAARATQNQMLVTVDMEYTDCTDTVRTKDKEWCFTYRSVKSHAKLTAYGKHNLSDFEKQNLNQQCPNGIVGGVAVQISDRSLVKAFSDIKVRETQRRKAAEKKALQEKTKKELDSLSL